MKKTAYLSIFIFFGASMSFFGQSFKANPSASADEEIERQKILRAADSIEEIRSVVDGMTTQVVDLKKEIADLKSENQKLQTANKTLLDNDKKLEEAIKKVDTARESDRQQIANDLTKGIDAIKKAQENQPVKNTTPTQKPKEKKTGEEAKVNVKEQEYYEHIVEKGHTLVSIAKVYEVKVEDIQKANDLKGANIKVGHKLLIPKK